MVLLLKVRPKMSKKPHYFASEKFIYSQPKINFMEAIILSKEHYEAIVADLKEIKTHVKKITVPNESFIDNKQFTKLMDISVRTAHAWRKERKIGYSQEGKKIYYRLSDISMFLDNHHQNPLPIQKKEEAKKIE